MRNLKLSTKRVVGMALATALAFSGTVAVAGSSEAAVAAVKASPSTGATAGGTVVTITGKGFASTAGVSKVSKVWFETTTCNIANVLTNPVLAANLNVVSSTKITITTPALALAAAPAPTVFNLCVSNTGDAAVIGTVKFTSYAKPTINTLGVGTATVGLSPVVGKSTGGGTITIQGEHFTAKTTATVGGVPLTKVKVEIGSVTTASATLGDDSLTGTLPAGTGAANKVVVTSEGGPSANSAVDFGYLDVVTVSPSVADGSATLNGITLTGTGFNARKVGGTGADFDDVEAVLKSVIVFKPVGALYTIGGTAPGAVTAPNCTGIQVVSDTELTCKAPDLSAAAAAGGYQVMIIDFGAATISAQTALTASSIYTVAPF